MRLIESINDIKAIIRSQKSMGKTIGLVPTMGYLHEGHMSLVNMSVQHNDFTVLSVFVNPTQFGPNEDFDRYPRDIERDIKMAEAAGVDVVFSPSVEEMYPDGYKTYVEVEDITKILCGRTRPGHFKGVTTVVNKLFNIVQPDRAYFGQKDAQQVVVINKMVKDLNMNVEIVTCPIVREEDGLAMSSRNVYLSTEERKSALILSKSLFEAQELIKNGENRKENILKYIVDRIKSEKGAQIDYVEIVNADTLDSIGEFLKGRVLIALAVKFGNTRLIDNAIVEV
ncbi:MAG TPA: pantoate--beta-alanine ligase [Acetivibrio sp.]|jgi:pantoate--beta-alanine ligase|nr:pantoate--beta-alanine ligase [Clostridium sp.]HOQ36237.1 pantoate--beta-alanine ligase [Acetivibrio sp.]HPT90353.1 pantoate--beta-alanine ligase [Acetivibrio sp.]HQA56727.1 pantoate--beta-alanine ligase [Acetivibrio sp.]